MANHIVEEGNGRGSPLDKRIEVRLVTGAAIVVEVSLDDAHRCCNGATQGWCSDARSWRLLNGSKPEVGGCHEAWDGLAVL